MFSKKLKLSFVATLLAISPVAIVASCSQTAANQESQTLLKATVFNAKDLGLNLEIGKAIKEINETWLIQHKDQIFNGSTSNLNNANQIKYLQADANLNQLTISFKLAAGAYTGSTGEVASQDSLEFSFRIKGFNSDQSGQIIDLETVAKTASFKVANLSQLASKVQLSEIIWDQAGANQQVSFVVNSLIPDDQTGHLGFNFSIYQTDLTTNNLTVNVLPDSGRAITGFQKVVVQPSDQKLVDEEINRLSSSNIDANELTNLELINFEKQPQLFIEHLVDLRKNQFSYNVLTFSYQEQTNQQAVINIDLKVSNKTASGIKKLTKTIKILNINLNNPELVRETELKRLNHLANNSYLLKTDFNPKEIEELKQNPNQIIDKIFQFISQQYFHYKVVDFKVIPTSKTSTTINANLSFRISAKYWKTIESNPPIITSQIFNYPITITYEEEWQPDTTNYQWHIRPISTATGNDDNGYDITFDLNNNSALDLAKIDWNNGDQVEKLVKEIIKANQNNFVTVQNTIDPKWTWDENLISVGFDPDKPNNPEQVKSFSGTVYVLNVNSQDLDEQLILNLTFTNGYNSGQVATQPTEEEIWNQIQQEFEELVNNQQFDETKIHQGLLGGVYNFSQISIENIFKSNHFTNFLNFSPTDFSRKWKFLVKAEVSDVSIDYLTNTVKFKWHLVGQSNLSKFKWTSPQLLILKYQPTNQWKDLIHFDDQGALAITGGVSINNILDRFTMGNNFIGKENQKEKFQQFGKNWTWKAREFANYLRFSFYQAFNDGADAINMAIINLPQVDHQQNPSGYTIVLKAKLNKAAEGNYVPYLQMFGADPAIKQKNWKAGDIIEMRLRIDQPDLIPDVVTDSNEIFPGMNPGAVLGKGQGAVEAYLNTPPRTDLYSIALGKTNLTINHNNQHYLSFNANHRFLTFNMMSRYEFRDPIWQEPNLDAGWIK